MNKLALLATLLLTLGLVGCGEQAEEVPTETPAPATEAAPATPAPSAGGGGYEPSSDERVPGITMSQEELDKLYAAAKEDIPAVAVPSNEKAD